MKIFDRLNNYSLLGFLALVKDIIFTKLFFSNARLVRFPLRIRGKEKFEYGKNFTTGVGNRIDIWGKDSKLKIGNNVEINDYNHFAISELIEIKDNVLIASRVFITDHDHGKYSAGSQSKPFSVPSERALSSKPVIIEKNVWIGESVIILPGVRIGEGSVIGAGSVVTKSIPRNSIAFGNPAKAFKEYNNQNSTWEKI